MRRRNAIEVTSRLRFGLKGKVKTPVQLTIDDVDELPIRLGTQFREFRHIRQFEHGPIDI